MSRLTCYNRVRNPMAPTIGLFGIGLAAYWPQFPGLEDRLKGYTEQVDRKGVVYDWSSDVCSSDLQSRPKSYGSNHRSVRNRSGGLLAAVSRLGGSSQRIHRTGRSEGGGV